MQLFKEKKSDRIRIPRMVSVDPNMAQSIKARAERMQRTVGSEIVHLLTEGLSNDREQTVHEHFFTFAHIMAPPRTMGHANSQERRQRA